MKNRSILMLITLVAVLSVGACGKNTNEARVESTEVESTEVESEVTDEAHLNDTEGGNLEVVDVSKLPEIPCASSVQTSIPTSIELENYKTAFNEMYGLELTGEWGAYGNCGLDDYGDGLGVNNGSRYIIAAFPKPSEWFVRMSDKGLSELEWDALRNILRLGSPDGESMYNEVRAHYYGNDSAIYAEDVWVTIGTTEVQVTFSDTSGYILYFR